MSRIVNVSALIATGVNADGHREILGLDVATGEDGASWLAFCRGLVARGLSGVALVVSDAHQGAPQDRHRSGAARRGLAALPHPLHGEPVDQDPQVSGRAGLVGTLVRSIFDQPDAEHVHAQHALVVAELQRRFPAAPSASPRLRRRSSPSPRSRPSTGARSAPITLSLRLDLGLVARSFLHDQFSGFGRDLTHLVDEGA